MRRIHVRTLSPVIALLLSVTVLACGDGGGGGGSTEPVVPASITVTPESVTFSSLGETRQLSWSVLDAAGSPVNVPVGWASSNTSVATVSTGGVLIAVRDGTATITVAADEFVDSMEVTVAQMAAALVVLPSSLSLMATLTDRISVHIEDAQGNAMLNATVAWGSDNLAVATIDAATGDITGVAVGTAMITATSGTASSDVALSVIPLATATFSGSVEPIFTMTCARAGCHTGGSAPNGMDLSAGNAYSNTVDVASTDVPAMERVSPNAPLESYLVHKLRGSQAVVGGAGSRMPLGGSVSNDEIAAIVAWILSGAANN